MPATTRTERVPACRLHSVADEKYVIGFVALLVFAVFAVVVASNSNPESRWPSRADVNNLPVGPRCPAQRREGLDQLGAADPRPTCRARSSSTTSGPIRA